MDSNTAVTTVLTILMAAMTVAAIGLAVSAAASRAKMRAFQARQELNIYFLLTFSSLLAKVAMSDGSMSSIEELTVEHMLSGMGLPQTEHAMCLGNFIMGRNDKRNAKTIAAEFESKMGQAASSTMYALLWRVARADGRIDNGENTVLDEIAMAMHLPEQVRVGFRSGMVSGVDQLTLFKNGVPQSLIKLVR